MLSESRLLCAAASDQKVMAGEALDRRNIWEPSVYYSLGKENFQFAGHDISIRESIDTFGALIWPGVQYDHVGVRLYCTYRRHSGNFLCRQLLCASSWRTIGSK